MLLAAIGEVESSSLRGRTLDAAHDAVPPVVGPALTGRSFAAIRDSDHGVWDGDPVRDHAVGGRDLSRPGDLQAAVLSYNHSSQYLATVLGIVQAVDSGQLAGP